MMDVAEFETFKNFIVLNKFYYVHKFKNPPDQPQT